MANNLYQYVFHQNLTSREEVYDFLASQIESETLTQEEIKGKFLEREALGSIEIAKGVVLPHFEGAISKNKIIILRPKDTIANWSENVGKVDLVIALALANESDKTEVLDFVKKLASNDFIEKLKQEDSNQA
jgi:mannitol/fructose-specific phosphotransferase system IIA component (Ntr-type)